MSVETGASGPVALRVLLTRVAKEQALPFAVKGPNARAARAVKEARRGGLRSAANVDELNARH